MPAGIVRKENEIMNLTKEQQVIIIAAVIGALGAIIAALIMTYKVKTIEVKLVDSETKKNHFRQSLY